MMKCNHKCKNLFDIMTVNDFDTKNIDNSLLMMIGTTQSALCGSPPMFLAGAIVGTGVHILVDTGATHNVIDINVARPIGLLEQRINTTILIGSGHEISCRAGAFSVQLCIDVESFHVNAFLLDIGNNIDIALGTPWLASLGRMVGTSPTWSSNISTMVTPSFSPPSDLDMHQRWSSLYQLHR